MTSMYFWMQAVTLRWRHNRNDGVSYHQPHDCLLNRLFRRRSKKTSKLRVTGLCAGNSPVTGEFPAQMARNAENVSIWWRHHESSEYEEYVLPWKWRHISAVVCKINNSNVCSTACSGFKGSAMRKAFPWHHFFMSNIQGEGISYF